ncbi:MAG: caspase family protein [Deinococcales bacterium]
MLFFSSAHAKRLALVVGNSDYQYVSNLRNPPNDAKDIANSLRELGFEVTEIYDIVNKRFFQQEVISFRQRLTPDDIAFFYYSGHGAQIDDVNYLIPTQAALLSQSVLKEESLSVNYILDEIQTSGSKTVILVLDACRNLPRLQTDERSLTKGLAEMPRQDGSLIAFAAAAGQTALDGLPGEQNSPYVARLKNLLLDPNLDLVNVFTEAQIRVYEDTGGQQRPQNIIDIYERIYLAQDIQNIQGKTVNTINISFNSEPLGAMVYIDGQLKGQTPLDLNLDNSNYQVILKLKGYEDYQQLLSLTKDISALGDAKVEVILKVNDSDELVKRAKAGGRVYLAKGNFYLSESLVLNISAELISEGYETTKLISMAGDYVLFADNLKRFIVRVLLLNIKEAFLQLLSGCIMVKSISINVYLWGQFQEKIKF